MVEFLEANTTNKFKNKLILDNASNHRNPKVKELINKDNYYMRFLIKILPIPQKIILV